MYNKLCIFIAFIVISSVMQSHAEIMNPADVRRKPSVESEPTVTERKRSWEMLEVEVVGKRPSALRDEQLIGSYAQPRWTAIRRFPTTRVYVVPEGKVEFEYWLITTFQKNGVEKYRSLYEIEFGLPYRFQLDLYLRTDQSSDSDEIYISEQIELRYALADWGKIPGNPTLYLEWIRKEKGPNKVEGKLLLGDILYPRWHWGLNFVGEFETGGKKERELQVTGGLSYTVVDSKFYIGAECRSLFTDTEEDRGNFEKELLIGPSIQFRPLPAFTVNIAGLWGTTDDSARAQVWFNCGYEF